MQEIIVERNCLITPDQAAALCGVSPITVRQWIRRGHLVVAKYEGRRIWLHLLHVARADQVLRARGYRSEPGATWRLRGISDAELAAVLSRADELIPGMFQPVRRSVVYYLQFGDRIKIGWSLNPRGRFDILPHDAVLVTEPGGPPLERERHRKFAEFRIYGEWFTAAPPLLEHIARLAGE